jgi:hypothetical protein
VLFLGRVLFDQQPSQPAQYRYQLGLHSDVSKSVAGYRPGLRRVACGYGGDAIIQINGVRFDLDLHSDGSGNQVLCADVFSGNPSYCLGTNPVTLEVFYNSSTMTASIFVNGTKVISNYAGAAALPCCAANSVQISGENATFSQVELETNVPPSSAASALQILPQLAFGGGWYTALYFTNISSTPVSFSVNFIGDDGNPLTIPALGSSSATVSLAARGTAIIQAPNVGSLVQGYVSVALPTGVTGYGVFRQSVPGQQAQEAVVPLSGATATTSTLLFDDTNYITGVAVVNLASVSTTISVTAYDDNGNILGTSAIPLAANAKTAVVLRNLPGLAGIAGALGSVDFTAPIGNLAVLGLRFNGFAFTSIPTFDK